MICCQTCVRTFPPHHSFPNSFPSILITDCCSYLYLPLCYAAWLPSLFSLQGTLREVSSQNSCLGELGQPQTGCQGMQHWLFALRIKCYVVLISKEKGAVTSSPDTNSHFSGGSATRPITLTIYMARAVVLDQRERSDK